MIDDTPQDDASTLQDQPDPNQAPVGPSAMANAFIQNRIMTKYPQWDGITWSAWTPREIAEMVRAIAQDYLEDHGHGHDWQEAGNQAQFVLCGIYNDVLNFRTNGQASGHEYDMRLTVTWPGREESFEILLMRPSEHLLAPVPLPNGTVAVRELTSIVGQASVRAVAPFDCLRMPDEGILALLDLLSAFLESKDRLSLMMAAAMLVRWKGCQVSQVVQGGAVYRQVKNPEYPQFAETDVRILYARTGNHLERHFPAQGPHSNVVVLV